MFDAQCDLAALVYEPHRDPDAVLRNFAADLNVHGFRVVGMVQAGQAACASSSAAIVMRWKRGGRASRPETRNPRSDHIRRSAKF
ncbi:DUF2478 domain-containing protein [Bradyrhizobium commune]|uniref:DUF2478 domain-containing protein n=1 Tax=Bradyrhizobium commune TaxID=83627 RepID=A0A7S9D126_9BRAD|nr:DUF2478 domain-containing protein [Bradyrhizobium commune]QPF89237.1 DUF2478 domain-containing protein [Bradyrhizobium commune]